MQAHTRVCEENKLEKMTPIETILRLNVQAHARVCEENKLENKLML